MAASDINSALNLSWGFVIMNLGRSKTDKLACQFCRIKLAALGGKINTSHENLGFEEDDDDWSGLKGVLAGSHRRLIKWKEKSRCGAETKALGCG